VNYYPQRRRKGWLNLLVGGVIPLAALLWLSGSGHLHLPGHAGGAAATGSVTGGGGQPIAAPRAVPVTGPGEDAFMTAVLADLGIHASRADLASLAAWSRHEFPSGWPVPAAFNPMASTHWTPGSRKFNTFRSRSGKPLHVWDYPSARAGAAMTAVTLSGPDYKPLRNALRSGRGLCGPRLAAAFHVWNGGTYSSVC
jgi:hypothetical protein